MFNISKMCTILLLLVLLYHWCLLVGYQQPVSLTGIHSLVVNWNYWCKNILHSSYIMTWIQFNVIVTGKRYSTCRVRPVFFLWVLVIC